MTKQADKDVAWAAKAMAITLGGGGLLGFLIWLGIQVWKTISEFYTENTVWFWVIVSFIILGIIYYFARNYINGFVKSLVAPKPNSPPNVIKPDIADNKRKKHDE